MNRKLLRMGMGAMAAILSDTCQLQAQTASSPIAPSAVAPAKEVDVKSSAAKGLNDDAIARETAEQINRILDLPPDRMLVAARRVAHETLAVTIHGRRIAALQARERRLEVVRLQMLNGGQAAEQEGKELRAELDKEIEAARQQFARDPKALDQAILELVRAYRPTLQAIKGRQEQCEKRAAETQTLLAEVRRERIQAEQASKLTQRGLEHRSAWTAPVVPDFKKDKGTTKPLPANASEAKSTETAAQALKSVEEIYPK